MDFYALSAPNSGSLSDNVIGSVVQRTCPVRSRKNHVEDMALYKQQTQRPAPYTRLKTGPQTKCPAKSDCATSAQVALASAINSMEPTGLPTSVCPSDLETVNKIISSIQATKHPISAELQTTIVAEALKKKIHRRERCRVNQARYRQRQVQVKNDIEGEIATLQAEIKELESPRCKDPARRPIKPTIWVLAADYFRHFRHFLSSPTSLQATAADFLQRILAPDVIGASLVGVEAQIENWRLFSVYFGGADVVLEGMNMPAPDTLVASTCTTVTITSNTLRYAFPHLNEYENDGDQEGVWSPVAAKMLGRKLVMRGSVTFSMDNSSGKLVRLQTQTDMLCPMLKLLGRLEDVSHVLDQATITSECLFFKRQ